MRVLVTAASRHGATTEIAEAIGRTLRETGLDAEVVAPDEIGDLGRYQAVVLGSAVYAGRWLEPARRFAQRRYAALVERPVWLFSSGPIGVPLQPTEEPRDGADFLRQLGAREHRVFAGRLNRDELGWVERTITGMVTAPDGDFRDWNAIGAWASQIAGALRARPGHGLKAGRTSGG